MSGYVFYLNYQTEQKNYATGIRTYNAYVLEMRKAMAQCSECEYVSGVDSGMPYCGMICCDIIETGVIGDCKSNFTTDGTIWVEFEAWLGGEISICGYMALDEADDEDPIYFYKWDGLEGGSHIRNTRCPSFTEDQVFKWEVLVDWFSTTDIVQYLVDSAEKENILKFRAESDWGRLFDVELYINCSKLDGDSE